MSEHLQLIAPTGLPEVQPGDDLADLILTTLRNEKLSILQGDVLVIAQKIVSKAEGRFVHLEDVKPSVRAKALAEETRKDPRVVELILSESLEVIRVRPGVIVVEHRNGYVHANAGIDQSNIPQRPGEPQVLLLPKDPDVSADNVRNSILTRCGVLVGVVINDSVGRAWRRGTIGMALGSAGIDCLHNRDGELDMYGRPLKATEVAIADELAAAASLLMGEAGERRPLVIVRGGDFAGEEQNCRALLRARELDMFR